MIISLFFLFSTGRALGQELLDPSDPASPTSVTDAEQTEALPQPQPPDMAVPNTAEDVRDATADEREQGDTIVKLLPQICFWIGAKYAEDQEWTETRNLIVASASHPEEVYLSVLLNTVERTGKGDAPHQHQPCPFGDDIDVILAVGPKGKTKTSSSLMRFSRDFLLSGKEEAAQVEGPRLALTAAVNEPALDQLLILEAIVELVDTNGTTWRSNPFSLRVVVRSTAGLEDCPPGLLWGCIKLGLVQPGARAFVEFDSDDSEEVDFFDNGSIALDVEVFTLDLFARNASNSARGGVSGSFGFGYAPVSSPASGTRATPTSPNNQTSMDAQRSVGATIFSVGGFLQLGRAVRLEIGALTARTLSEEWRGKRAWDSAIYFGVGIPTDLAAALSKQ
jgi:hypothetical protein